MIEEQARSTSAFHQELTEPQLYLSSTQAGWEGLVAQAFHEPREMEGWSISPHGDIMLMLYAGGPMHVERRWAHGPWKGEDIHPGELVLNWGNGAPYEIRWWSLTSVPTQTLDIHLNRALVNRVAEEVVGVDLASLELVRRTGIHDPLLVQIGLALWHELEQPAPAGKLYAQTAAQLLALHLVRHYTASNVALRAVPPSPQGLTERQVKQVQEFILTHLSEDLSLERLAQQIGFSSYHFARLFRKATGASLHQVVLRQRIEHAQWLLHKTDMPLAHIASACGFADQSHLTQVFRRYLGLTPHVYRQQRDGGKIFTMRAPTVQSYAPRAVNAASSATDTVGKEGKLPLRAGMDGILAGRERARRRP
ncbi:MAG TPA: AraC family transcriptional regulator [Ktedonobacterales bacterium]|nr:AraC family transcriptional regulator [Ktedonobacterales bacterium]